MNSQDATMNLKLPPAVTPTLRKRPSLEPPGLENIDHLCQSNVESRAYHSISTNCISAPNSSHQELNVASLFSDEELRQVSRLMEMIKGRYFEMVRNYSCLEQDLKACQAHLSTTQQDLESDKTSILRAHEISRELFGKLDQIWNRYRGEEM